jgi:hypothetical protein
MATISKAAAAEVAIKAHISRKSFSIPEFCYRHGLSEGKYRDLRKQGKGPRERRYGRLVRITDEAEAAWMKSGQVEAESA